MTQRQVLAATAAIYSQSSAAVFSFEFSASYYCVCRYGSIQRSRACFSVRVVCEMWFRYKASEEIPPYISREHSSKHKRLP
jgi:hypothetical protein